ncbi:TonB-dependent receptor [Ideonella sp. YS5]|uniref:TonB-dependent receptor n=1 Tax=Ideonella sp. YS5 TaxID=3453714 RepID=UPI003EEFD586
MSKQFRPTPIHRAVIQLALLSAGGVAATAYAQTQADADKTDEPSQVIVVKGQRAALQSAQKIKQNADEIVDSVVAEEAGKLPDKSITEVLQRVVGVTIERQRSTNNDPKHFSEEGSGIKVRGLSWGASTLNGREVFSAGWPGRDLSWSAVPAELMAGVDVYKNPSAEKIEGGVSGLVDLRTHLPFDFSGTKSYVSFGSNYEERTGKASPAISGLFSTRWEEESGHWGVLVDLAMNNSSYEQQKLDVGAYFPRTDVIPGRTVWAPTGADWGQNLGTSNRKGFYGALQWKKNEMQSAFTAFVSNSVERNTGSNVYPNFGDPNFNSSPYHVVIDNPVVDDRGVVVSGHYRYPTGNKGANNFAEGGISMGTSRAFNEHRTSTGELAWNFKWNVDDRWSVQNDLQYVRSTFHTRGEEVQTATFIPSMDINTAGNGPVQLGFDQHTRDFLANPDNYYWLSVMPGRLKGEANLYAWKADARYKFDDPVLRDIGFGVRSSYRTSVREAAVYAGDLNSVGWQSIAVPWEVRQTKIPGTLPTTADDPTWAPRANFGYLSDPRYAAAGQVEVFNYSPFGGNQPPSVVFPTYGMLKDYSNYAKLLGEVRYQQCLDGARHDGRADSTCVADNYKWDTTLHYGLNPNMTSDVAEATHAAFTNLRFGFDDWAVPMEGNAGVRLVYTRRVSHGFTNLEPKYDDRTPPDVPRFESIDDPLDVQTSHVDALPSMNLKFNLSGDDKLIGRIAVARSLYRPGFNQVQESVALKQTIDTNNNKVTYTGENTGNAKLRPLKADSLDLALEWYPRPGQMVTATVFYKDVKDVIYNSYYTRNYNSVGGNPQAFTIKGPRNAAEAWVHGFELNAETYLDHFDALKDTLPDWAKGFGVSANYTHIDSSQKFYRDAQVTYCPSNAAIANDAIKVYGCDTNGLPLGAQPVQGLVKNAANFALRYDRYGFSARLAYNWTDRVLQNLGTEGQNGTSADPQRAGAQDTWWGLPRYQEAYGQWDGGMSYQFTDKLSMSLSVTNLNNVTVRYTNMQTPGFMGTSWAFPGRSYYLTGRYEF